MKLRTKYQQCADRVIELHPTRILIWHQSRLFWKISKGWLELVVGNSPSWFQAPENVIEALEKGSAKERLKIK